MKKRSIFSSWTLVTVLFMVMAVTLPAEAQKPKPRPATYVEAGGGVCIPSGDWFEAGWQTRENIELALGYHFLPFMALEAGFHHFNWYWEQATPNWIDIKIYANGVILTPKLIYPLKRFEFYLGAGAGYYWLMQGTHVITLVESYGEVTDNIWGFHAVAGASFDIFRWLYLGLEGKYVMLFNFLDSANITGWALTASIGFRFL